ncbi:MAG: hypothetical protein R2697_21610 [Ilumatobacteraceae bacterium]
MLELGQEIEVVVEEIDDRGKVSLTPAGAVEAPSGNGDGGSDDSSDDGSSSSGSSDDVETVSFEDSFDAGSSPTLGDLGPAGEKPRSDRGDRGGRGRRRHR